MKISYSPKNSTTLLLVLSFFYSINIQAKHEHHGKETWKNLFEYILNGIDNGVNSCTSMNASQAKVFQDYFSTEIQEETGKIYKAVKNDSLNTSNADEYIGQVVIKYVELFHQFQNGKLNINPETFIPSLYGVHDDTIRPDPGPCQPACANLGFEDGTLNNWVACGANAITIQPNDLYPGSPGPFFGFRAYKITKKTYWDNHMMKADCYGPTGNLKGAADSYLYIPTVKGPNYQVRIMDPGFDHIDPTVPTVYPGMTHSAILGDSSEVCGGAAILEQKFLVTPGNAAFTYMYAAFLENPNHPYWQQPYFRVSFFDQNGDTLKGCGNYLVTGGPNTPGFYPMNEWRIWEHNDTMYIKPWTCVFVSLRKYIGQCVTVQFVTGDCQQGAHGGYAYVDAKCGSLNITETGNCKAKVLTAPVNCGVASYQWIGPCISGATNGSSCTVTCDGIYKLILTPNEGGCPDTLIDTVKFGVSSLKPVIKGTNLKCNASNSGSATVTLAGNTSDYAYSWSPNGGTALTASGLSAGNYSVKITSIAGCGDTTINITLSEPAALLHQSAATPATCGMADGSATVTESGGTGSYTYSWNSGAATSSILNVKAGSYTVTVQDGAGCKDTAAVKIQGGSSFNTTASLKNIQCFGDNTGTASVSTAGGTAPFTFNWLSGGPASSSYSGLVAGTYTCVVNDKNSTCADTIIVTLTQPQQLKILLSSSPATCHGTCDGQINMIPGGGITPYTYVWSNNSTTASLSALCSGMYTVTLMDKNGCVLDTSVSIAEPPAMVFTKTSTPTTCGALNGTASASVTGAAGPYTYLWNTFSTGTSLLNVASGTYTLTATDSKGCKDTVHVTIANIAPELVSTASTGKLLCHGDVNGSLSVNTSGAGAPYTYFWSTNQSTASINNLGAGTFTVTVTDKNGCASIAVDSIVQPTPLSVITTGSTVCSGQAASVTALGAGGTGVYTYLWSNNSTNPALSDSPGSTTIYSVTITDANGCKTVQSDTIKVNPSPQSFFKRADVCIGSPVQFVDSSAIAAGKITSWLWDFGDNSTSTSQNPSHLYSKDGSYSITLKVSAGPCSSTLQKTVTVFPKPKADFSMDPQPATILDPTVTFSDLSVGGIKGKWSFGDATDTNYQAAVDVKHTYVPDNLRQGEDYTAKLFIVNQYGCPDSISKTVHFGPEWTFFVPNAFSPNGDGKNEVFFGTGIGLIEKEMWIMDRWGLQIFHTIALDGAWDGKVENGGSAELAQQDVYIWIIKVKEVFGKSHKYMGHVTLVR